MSEYKKMAIQALEDKKGDDTYRAKMAFRNCSPEQMKQEYGQSGETRQAILDSYIERDKRIDAAIAWVRSMPDEARP